MRSHHLLDPDLAAIAAQPPTPTPTHDSLAQARAVFAVGQAAAAETPFQDGVREERWIDAGDASDAGRQIRLMIYRRAQSSGAVPGLLHIHPGGFIFGGPEISTISNQSIVEGFDCVIISVDYRLAPECRFPGALEDCRAALQWMADNAAELGIDTRRIAVIGESAGAGLAAALALKVRDAGGPSLAMQVLLYPMLDDRTAVAEAHPYTGEFVWQPAKNHFGWSAILGHEPGLDGVSPYAAPARAADLAGLPPSYLAIGALDLFVEEDMDYARRLIRAGVPTEFHLYPGAPHAFDRIGDAAVTQAMRRDRLAALMRGLRP